PTEFRSFRARLSNLPAHEGVREWEMRIAPPRGRRPFDATVRVMVQRGARGEPLGLRWVVRNITERKRFESRVQRSTAELEARVPERTAELRTETQTLEILNHLGRTIAGELDLESLVQAVTNATTQIVGARLGLFLDRPRLAGPVLCLAA